MRWCEHCRNFNTGWPVRCRHCAAGLAGRLCSRNHINPPDPLLAFCGDCGQPLSQAFGGSLSLRSYVVALAVFVTTAAVAVMLLAVTGELGIGAFVLALVVLVVGGRLSHQLLPPSAQHRTTLAYKALWFVCRMLLRGMLRLLRAIRRTGLKGRGRRGRGRR